MMSDYFEQWTNESIDRQRLVAEETLILDVTEEISLKMEELGINRTELATRLGKSKPYVSQLLNGSRNMTLRSLADIGVALQLDIPKFSFGCDSEGKLATSEWSVPGNFIMMSDNLAAHESLTPTQINNVISMSAYCANDECELPNNKIWLEA